MMKARLKRDLELLTRVIQQRRTIERWYNRAAIKFMKSRNFRDNEERLLEEVTDFFLNDLESACKEADNIEEQILQNN